MIARLGLAAGLILCLPALAHAEKRFEHLPDGRWLFVDPDNPPRNNQTCDFQGQCYSDKPTAEAQPPKPAAPPAPSPQSPVADLPPPMPDHVCAMAPYRLYRTFDEVRAMHARCEGANRYGNQFWAADE